MQEYHRIRDLREDTDKTQEETAKELSMHTTTYARYEKGIMKIPLDFAVTIAKYYKVSIDYIAGLTNDKKGLTRSTLSEEQTELLKILEKLPDIAKGKLLAKAEELEEKYIKAKNAG